MGAVQGGRILYSAEGLQPPLVRCSSAKHRLVVTEGGAIAEPNRIHAVRGVVYDGERIGFTSHDDRGWDIPSSWREEDEEPFEAFERAAYEALGCYVRPPEFVGALQIDAERELGLPYGGRTRSVTVALYLAALDRNDVIEEEGKNPTQYAPIQTLIDAPALTPLQPWLRWVEAELRRRFDSLS